MKPLPPGSRIVQQTHEKEFKITDENGKVTDLGPGKVTVFYVPDPIDQEKLNDPKRIHANPFGGPYKLTEEEWQSLLEFARTGEAVIKAP